MTVIRDLYLVVAKEDDSKFIVNTRGKHACVLVSHDCGKHMPHDRKGIEGVTLKPTGVGTLSLIREALLRPKPASIL